MATDKSAEALVVLESFIGRIGNEDRFFLAGQQIRAGDPAIKKWPERFGPLAYPHDRIESATAAPGEKRGA